MVVYNSYKWREKSTIMIETERLLLRPFRENDAADVYEYLKEPMVNCFACMKLHSLEEFSTLFSFLLPYGQFPQKISHIMW